jgi:hypothetical protein
MPSAQRRNAEIDVFFNTLTGKQAEGVPPLPDSGRPRYTIMINSVCLLGSAAGRNAGDAALISGIMEAIDLRLKRRLLYRVPTLFPRFVEQTYRHNRVEAINVMPWTGSLKLLGWPTYRAVTGSDLSLVFDAVLFDRSLFNPMFNFLSSLYFLLPAAKKAGRRVGLYNCGVGPITTDLGAKMLKKVCDSCDFITVREEGSAEVLRRRTASSSPPTPPSTPPASATGRSSRSTAPSVSTPPRRSWRSTSTSTSTPGRSRAG